MDSVKKWEYGVTHCGVSKHKHHFSPKYGSFKAYIGLVYIRNKSDKIKKTLRTTWLIPTLAHLMLFIIQQ